ncbi:CoA pyrophosphatase [Nocardioides gansuensis]|uniref:CoA pyrophosphatase n=1 Tax=Nocardioides gansuensis TaxID=2138300 RepID=A0A2T8FA58_9ACTN|nr:CoA pyrophosphatase [Nocardioides gansuensis]
MPLPDWLVAVAHAADTLDVDDLTTFRPPDDGSTRKAAVLILFADSPPVDGVPGELLLTERAHHMRTQPGQVSFPGGSTDPGETAVEAALREAEEEVGLDPAGIHVFGSLPELWLPPSNFAVTPVLGYWHAPAPVWVSSPDEVHAVHHVPIAELLDPEHRITVTHPSGYRSPGFLIGPDKDVILWGFTAGILSRLFDHLGWTRDWDQARLRDLPQHMLQGGSTRRPRADTTDQE